MVTKANSTINLKIWTFFSAYFSQAEYNIITIDYHHIASSLKCYAVALQNLPIIAKCITQFLISILDKYNQFEYVHAIGYSLGAQAAGLVGKQLKEKGKHLDRATGNKITLNTLVYHKIQKIYTVVTEYAHSHSIF